MKDLTHYFNSPSPSLKKPETSPAENKTLVDEKTPKMNKKVRKKRLKLDKLTPPQTADSKQDLPIAENGTEVAKSEVVNGDSSVIEVGSDTGCNTASERKKKKRKLSPSCEDASKRTKRKVAKGRLKIINVPSDSPDSSNSPKPQLEVPNDSGLAKDILVNSLLVDKLSMLVSDHEDDGGYEIEDDSDQDEDYSSKKVKRKRKKRKSTKRTSVEKDGTVATPLVNDNLGEKESSEKIVEVEPVAEKRNSLFSYYSKVDKSVINKERTSEKIRVQALVHTPPSEKRRSSSNHTPSSSAKASLKKKFIRLQRELMKASDAIEVVSSEEIVQSGTLNAENSCDTSATLLNDSNSCVAAELDVKTVHDWKIKINSKLTKSESVSTEDTLDNENEPPNSNTNNASDTLSKNDFNKLLSNKRTRKPNPKYSETVDKSEKSSETTANKVKNIKRQSKLKKSPPCPTIDLDESSNDSVCEARVVRESNANKNLNKNAKISSINGKSAGLMAKFLGKSLVTPKETVSKIVKVDPSVLIARQKFLKSGLPDDFRQKIASQIDENIPDPPPFPSVSHIQQRDPMRLIWNIPEPQLLKLGPSPTIDLELSSDWQSLFPDSQSDSSEHSDNGEPIKKIRNKSFIKDFLRTKANTQQSVNDRWALMKKLKSSGVDSACWTDIYKPKASNDILGNKSCVERFKIWLETYKNTVVKQTGEEGSSDDFVHSSDDSCSSPKERICIISGPIGCGKTSTVYAVAQELGYKVLEVNASHNRNGKKVTADLSEATQSHQVEHGSLKDIFNNSRKVKKKKTRISS
ncbi:ATPase family AAA domain-containing protein 5-like isoform X1 [Nilaparvata lugens]|uniref:ATPase family AAA domain-containing protein 5-like isoform X1 n=1 Tax=Nilaparvata lugens TaxID=108931 RepID=UPI00193CCCF4|nr:ATPase family AAA domain-containing protein 5-like isoform X1 [Nilaparvata lugens]